MGEGGCFEGDGVLTCRAFIRVHVKSSVLVIRCNVVCGNRAESVFLGVGIVFKIGDSFGGETSAMCPFPVANVVCSFVDASGARVREKVQYVLLGGDERGEWGTAATESHA